MARRPWRLSRPALPAWLTAGAGLLLAALLLFSGSVRAQVTSDVLRPWSCLTSSLAAGSVFPSVLVPGCPAPTSSDWPRIGRAATAINPPASPTGLSAIVIGRTVVLTWTPPGSGGAPTSYQIQTGSASGLSNLANANTGSALPTLTATAVPSGTYFFRVQARNASGTSASSNEVAVTVAAIAVSAACGGVPGPPTSLAGTVRGSDVTLTWFFPLGECVPSAYVIQAGSSPGLSNLVNFSTGNIARSFEANAVPTGVYYVRVRAVNAFGTSAPSNEVVVVVGTCAAPPGQVANLVSSVFGSSASLQWSAASGSPTGYFIHAGSSPGGSNLGSIGTGGGSYIATGVPAGTYYVRVSARNDCGTGPASNEVVVTVGGPGGPVGAVTLTTLHGFSGSPNDGSNLSTLIQGRDGNFYGTTVTGGPFNSRCSTNLDGCGTIFRMTASGAVTILHAFGPGGSGGAGGSSPPIYPYGTLLQASDGNLYGTVSEGASVFRMTPSGSVTYLTKIGGSAYGSLIEAADGNLYGTTILNGPGTCPERSTQCTPSAGNGTVYRVNPTTGALTYLHTFSGGADGAKPYAGLLQALDGNFYGTTNTGGAFNAGTIYKITPGGVLTTMHTFSGADGGNPLLNALRQASDGNFYGTTQFGGANATNGGVIFRMTPAGAYTKLHAFTGQFIADGTPPTGAASDGTQPVGGLFQASDGLLYGTTGGGGALGGGTAFSMTLGGAYSQIFTFAGNVEGSSPTATFFQATDGFLYGTAQYGGTFNKGVIFKMTLLR